VGLPGVDKNELRDKMACDWLAMVKGRNMPGFMRNRNSRSNEIAEAAKKSLGHTIRRDEAAVLLSGETAYVDSENRDPVTGLYKVQKSDLCS